MKVNSFLALYFYLEKSPAKDKVFLCVFQEFFYIET